MTPEEIIEFSKQMTLGEVIEFLEKRDPTEHVKNGWAEPNSYRGYYADLAFAPTMNTSIDKMLSFARGAVGQTYEGYKGGECKMELDTDVWLASWGRGGVEITKLLLFVILDPNIPPDSWV